MTAIATPHGLAEIRGMFGDPWKFILTDGTLSPQWEAENIIRVPLPAPLPFEGTQVTRVTCHTKLATIFPATLQKIFAAGLWPKLHSYGGGFQFRPMRGLSSLSLHTWGIAWDFDPEHNLLGTHGTMDTSIVNIFERDGFMWGGHFTGRKDPMHFQWATGY